MADCTLADRTTVSSSGKIASWNWLRHVLDKDKSDILKFIIVIDICNIMPTDTNTKDARLIIYYYICTKRLVCHYE